ncbi:MAG: hypothetical protein HGB14_00775 [Anaerolineaceae bacterium]|nr:hypothetical protein [Anaerolineaceae bacterium]
MKKYATTEPAGDRTNPDQASIYALYKRYNIDNNNPAQLMRPIEVLEENLVKKAVKNMLSMQPATP